MCMMDVIVTQFDISNERAVQFQYKKSCCIQIKDFVNKVFDLNLQRFISKSNLFEFVIVKLD